MQTFLSLNRLVAILRSKLMVSYLSVALLKLKNDSVCDEE